MAALDKPKWLYCGVNTLISTCKTVKLDGKVVCLHMDAQLDCH